MKVRTILPPLAVALLVAVVVALAARSPLRDAPAGLHRPLADDLLTAVAAVDEQLESSWRDAGIEPAEMVSDDLVVLRRLSLALHGTIPSLEEIRRFELDERPDRLAHWTNALLEDQRFADYFAERLARAFVGVDQGQFIIFRRDRFTEWLSQQIRDHRSYDEIVRDMIAGNGVWTGDAEVNFLTGAYANEAFDKEKLTGRVVRAFLGQRIDCAQCHDHPFDHWKRNQFEGLAAHFGQVRVSLVGVEDDARHLFRLPKELEPVLAAGEVTEPLRHAFGNGDQRRLRQTAAIETVEPNQTWIIRDAPEDVEELEMRFLCRRGPEGVDVYGIQGEYVVDDQTAGEVRIVTPAVPFHPEWVPDTGTRREQLAAWVTHPENRRFERAIANRVWALMFGRPYYTESRIDDLPDPDQDDPARQLPVLDLLGADFRAHGCDLRRLVRVIAGSKVFRLDSVHPAQAPLDAGAPLTEDELRDIRNELESVEQHWAVFPLVRLRPEQVIGAMLQANHVTTIDRNSHLFVRAQRFFRENDFVNAFGDPGEGEFEDRVGTIPQALLRMNGKFSQELTDTNPLTAPGRIAGMASTPEKTLDVCYLVCLTRRPTEMERDCFLPQLSSKDQPDGAIQDLFWTLFNSPEFSWNH